MSDDTDKYMAVSLHAELLDIFIRGYFTSFKGTGINLWEPPSVKNSVIQFVATASSSIFTSIAGNRKNLLKDIPTGFSKNSQMWDTDYLSVGAENVNVNENWKKKVKPLLIFENHRDFVVFDVLDYFVSAHLINLVAITKPSLSYTDIIPKLSSNEIVKQQNTLLQEMRTKDEYRDLEFRSFSTTWNTSEENSSNRRNLLYPMKHLNYPSLTFNDTSRTSAASLPDTYKLFPTIHSPIDTTPKIFCCKIGQLFEKMVDEDMFQLYNSLLSLNTDATQKIMVEAVTRTAKALDEHVIFTDYYPTNRINIDIDGKKVSLKFYMENNYIRDLTVHLNLYIYGNAKYLISPDDDAHICYRRILLVIYELLKRVLQYLMYESVVVYEDEERKIEYCQANLNCKSRILSILTVLNNIIINYNDNCPRDTLKLTIYKLDFSNLTMNKEIIREKLLASWRSKIILKVSGFSDLAFINSIRTAKKIAKRTAKRTAERTAKKSGRGLDIKLKKDKKQRTRTKPKPKKQRTRTKPKELEQNINLKNKKRRTYKKSHKKRNSHKKPKRTKTQSKPKKR
jgi:hypothetical protein